MDHPLLGNTTSLTLNYITDASPAFIREAASLILKGQCHEKKSLGSCKLNQNFLYMSADGFHNLAAFLWRNLKT
jgi:hypothetical protein